MPSLGIELTITLTPVSRINAKTLEPVVNTTPVVFPEIKWGIEDCVALVFQVRMIYVSDYRNSIQNIYVDSNTDS